MEQSVQSGYSYRTPPRSRQSGGSPGGGGGLVAGAIGRVVNPVIASVDMDEVMRNIDVNDVVSRVNWNDVIDEIDWNNLLEQIDVDALIDRIDVNALVERVDVNALIERSNLKQIIARSTSGMCSIVVNSFRALCIKMDQYVQRVGRGIYCGVGFCYPETRAWTLPPLPTVTPIFRRKQRKQDRRIRRSLPCPRKSILLATAVQGRNAGTFSRFLAFVIDKGLTIAAAFLFIVILGALINLIPEEETSLEKQIEILADGNVTLEELKELEYDEVSGEDQLMYAVGVPVITCTVFGFIFDSICLAAVGRTLGKMAMGLTVVNSTGGKVGRLTFGQAVLRSLLTNIGLVAIGALFSLNREDRRSLIDLLCGTTVIYAWDAKSYRLAAEDYSRDMPYGDLESLPPTCSVQTSANTSKRRAAATRNHSHVKTKVISVPTSSDDHGSSK